MPNDERDEKGEHPSFEIGLALGRIEAKQDRLQQQNDRIEASQTIADGAVAALATKVASMSASITALEKGEHRPRLPSLTQEALARTIADENSKQSESIRVAAMAANEPLIAETANQTSVMETTIKKSSRFQAYGQAIGFTLLGIFYVISQSCGHH